MTKKKITIILVYQDNEQISNNENNMKYTNTGNNELFTNTGNNIENNKNEDIKNNSENIIKKEENRINDKQQENKEENKNDKGNENLNELGKQQIVDEDPFMMGKVDNDSLFPAESIVYGSINIPNGLPNEIHNHALSEESLSNELCTICLKEKTCEGGYKCNLCPLIICDECADMIRLSHYGKTKHDHSLIILNEENCNCNLCKKMIDVNSKYNNFYFNCKNCNYNMCLKCYNSQRKDLKEEEESIHMHPLTTVNETDNFNCNSCNKQSNSGIKCSVCRLALCQTCASRILNHKKRKEYHEHPLILIVSSNWKCNLCESKYENKICFNCNKCSIDFCPECYLD